MVAELKIHCSFPSPQICLPTPIYIFSENPFTCIVTAR